MVGVTEAPYFPGCIFLLSSWYTKRELPSRIAIFYTGYTLASAFGGLIAAGIVSGMDGAGGYGAWVSLTFLSIFLPSRIVSNMSLRKKRWIFILEGAITVVAGIPAFWLLPNYPSNTAWLSAEESALAQFRLARDYEGERDEVEDSVFKGFKQSVSDPKSWLLVLIQTCAVMSMSFTCKCQLLTTLKHTRNATTWITCANLEIDFFPSIVQTLNYGRVQTLLLTAPPYFLACIYSITNSWHSGKTNERCFHIVVGCCISIVGQVTSMSTHNIGARYFVSLPRRNRHNLMAKKHKKR